MTYPESGRLKLIPLSVAEINLYLREDFFFEDHFGLERVPRAVPPALREAMELRTIPKLLKFPEHHLFYTHWNAIDKLINTSVAGIVLKGPPNDMGEVEIGYGTLQGFTGNNYMKETVQLFCEWIFRQKGVEKIVALTSAQNIASQKILEWNKFENVSKTDEEWRWVKVQ
jgi:RimJ/RimL family protein N-acetyltransferase